MIPKEVTDALELIRKNGIDREDRGEYGKEIRTIKNFLETTDRYVKELEQHVDDLVAGNHGIMEDD